MDGYFFAIKYIIFEEWIYTSIEMQMPSINHVVKHYCFQVICH